MWICLLWTSWIFTLLCAAQEETLRPRTEPRTGLRTEPRTGLRPSAVSPPRLDVQKPAAVRGAGEKVGAGARRRAALSGPHVCGRQCCVGWTLSQKTRTCIKSRCFPPCVNGALCRRPGRCVCRRGFSGSRCELSTVTLSLPGRPLTSIHPTIVPRRPPVHFNPLPRPPGPSTSLQRITKPPQSHISQPVSTTAAILNSKPGASQLNSTESHDQEDDAHTPDSGPHNVGLKTKSVSKRFPVHEQNRALRTEELKMKAAAEETPTRAEPDPELNDLQLWARDEERAEVTERTAKTNSDSEPEEVQHSHSEKQLLSFKTSTLESETLEKVSPGSQTEQQSNTNQNPETLSGSEGEESGNPQSDSAQRFTDVIPNPESSLRPKAERGEHVESDPGPRTEAKNQPLSLREAQAVLLRKTLFRRGRGDKMAALLMKHIEKERKRLNIMTSSSNPSSSSSSSSSSSASVKTSVKSFHSQKGQYTVHISAPAADGQTATAGGGGGGGVERIQVMFTPTICKVRCNQDRCVNYCERGNVTTLYSSSTEGGGGGGGGGGGRRDGSHGPGFRVFLCPLLCKNGGVCLQKDRCLCPSTFVGKFCQIPVDSASAAAAAAASPSSTNEIVKPALRSVTTANQELTQSEFLVPLGQNQEVARAGAPAPSMVKVRVQHPLEASVKIHQVLKVSGFSPTLRTLSSPASGSAGAPAPPGGGVQAQTVRGDGTYTEHSSFKYCFREVKGGQCSSPLPGLRSRDMCCRGIGKGWGITDCVLCPDTGQSNSSCASGLERSNGTQCVDVNECLRPGLCENGICVNTRGSYSCVCRAGFILDATHGICISQSVISEEKGQCFRVLGSGQGPSSCSLPILRNITKQICCCSRVGKAWGPDCQRCPYFGSVAFKEICPAGPGYHYSASALQFNQRVHEQLGGRGVTLVNHSNQDNQAPDPGSSSGGASRQQPSFSGGQSTSLSSGSAGTRPVPPPTPRHPSQPQTRPATSSPSTRTVQSSSAGTSTPQDKPPTPGRAGTQQVRPGSAPPHPRPQPPSTGSQAGGRSSSGSRPDHTQARGDTLPAPAQPQNPERGSRPHQELPALENRPAVSPTTRPSRVQTVRGVCETRPGVCGRGLCVDQPSGKHTCVCDQGYQPNTQRTYCQDVNECVQSPGVCVVGECVNTVGSYRCVCPSGYRSSGEQTSCQDVDECQLSPCRTGRCDNTPGSYRCVCRLGYRLTGNTCTDVDECEDPLQCPGQECVNTQGSYRCASCPPGYGLIKQLCTDVDECLRAPCSNARCENTPGSYRCVCLTGYRLQNNTCTDIDECAEPSQCPGQMCVNSVGSYRCVSCRPGYTLTNRQCTDVNECENSESCPGQQCVNTEGSYSCLDCQQGYHSVNRVCTDVDECVQVSQCPGQQCVNTVGSYHCVSCQPGYSSEDGSCQDVDECASAGGCEAERVCVNTVGSFRCDCLPGYRTAGLGRQCRDVNECLEGEFCFPRGECVNTPGSYTCVCSQGFTLSDNGTSCLDVDECSESGVCVDGRCVNTEGSFYCQCQPGFTTNPESTTCLDVDECVASGGSVCGSQRCENTIGSYRCLTSCEPGYQEYQGRCVDINECANKTLCGDHAFCQNLIGTHQCVCDRGFTSTPDGSSCVDEDECVSLAGVCGSARCENVEGSFMCECDRGEFDMTTRKCVSTVLPAETAPSYTSSSSSSSFSPSSSFSSSFSPSSSSHAGAVELDPVLPPLPPARPGELRECYYNLAERGTCSLLATNTSQQECCCTVGEGWGLGCQHQPCPPAHTADFLSLCPSGRGYVTTGQEAFSYRDVDECKRFHPEVCKNGVCVNNIPGYNCYCSSGYVYNSTLLECVDHDECEEESCVGGVCVNTVGSYYCSCPPPLVLDDTQRNCVNSSHLTVDENLSVCWQHVSADLMCQSPLLGAQFTFTDCCCLYGEGWGMECALCPSTDSDDYAFLCSSFPPLFPSYPSSSGSETGVRRGGGQGGAGAPLHFPPFSPDSFPPAVVPGRDFIRPDYEDYSPAGGSRSGYRTPASFSLPDSAYRRPEYGTGFYSEGDYSSPDGPPPRPPSFRLLPDPRAETAFGARPPPPSQPDGPPLSLAPLPGAHYPDQEEEVEETWRPGPPFPPFTEQRGGGGGGDRGRGGGGQGGGGGGALRRLYERRYESYAGLSAAEDCGILHGCENGRCIRVAEGYTCDCYQGYELDMTSMTCIDVNECEDGGGVEFPCVNARCVNTGGSFRCVCRRGYVMSRRDNHCVAA